jgi:5-methylcytosine-specific restriction protein A
MPQKPRSPCNATGCPNLNPCPIHGRRLEQAYDQRRGTAAQRGDDARHRRWRELVLAAHPVCVDPDRAHPGVVRASTVADHIVPLRQWEDRHRPSQAVFPPAATALARILEARGIKADMQQLGAWSLENGQGLCATCHAVKSSHEL